jgi:hypothetical protein
MSHSNARWKDDRRVEIPNLLDAAVPVAHQFVMRDLGGLHADGRRVAPRRERLAFAAPDDRPHAGPSAQLPEDLEKLRVHVVVERIVLFDVVVGDRGDGAVDLQVNSSAHDSPRGGAAIRRT